MNQNIILKCKNCGGWLNVDRNNQMLFCPYCGSREIYFENPNVSIERIRANTARDMEKERLEHEIELEKLKQQEEAQKFKRKMVYIITLIIIAILYFGFIAIMSFYFD